MCALVRGPGAWVRGCRARACLRARTRACVCVCVCLCVCARACWRDVSVWCLSVFARRGVLCLLLRYFQRTYAGRHLHLASSRRSPRWSDATYSLTSADPDSKVVHGDEAVISSARALFSAGRSRQTRNNAAGRKQRLDKGTGKFKVKASAAATPRGGTRRGVPQTEAAWLRRRRAELDAVISTPQPKSQSQN